MVRGTVCSPLYCGVARESICLGVGVAAWMGMAAHNYHVVRALTPAMNFHRSLGEGPPQFKGHANKSWLRVVGKR